MKKVWILQIDWAYRGERGRETVKVLDDEQKAKSKFRELLLNERCDTWIGDYVDEELKPLPDAEFDEYEFSDEYFCLADYALDTRTEVWIQSFDVE